jgi:hypothetical protein
VPSSVAQILLGFAGPDAGVAPVAPASRRRRAGSAGVAPASPLAPTSTPRHEFVDEARG